MSLITLSFARSLDPVDASSHPARAIVLAEVLDYISQGISKFALDQACVVHCDPGQAYRVVSARATEQGVFRKHLRKQEHHCTKLVRVLRALGRVSPSNLDGARNEFPCGHGQAGWRSTGSTVTAL